MKRKLINSLRLLLVAAGLCVGTNVAWATIYNGTTANYEVIFGSPAYTDEVITGVNPATEFTTDASEQNYTTMSLQISGSCLAGNQAGGRTYSFESAPTTGKVYFKANGYFVGGNYTFFNIKGSVTDSEDTVNPDYNIVQSPTSLPNSHGAATVLRIFGQNITASYVYNPRTVVYGFDVIIDMVNQKVDYTVTYASKGSSGTVTALSTVSGSVAVPDGYTLNSVSSWNLPRVGSSGSNYYDNVAFYSEVPNAILYSATFTETNDLAPTITIYSDSEMTEEISNGYLTDGTTYYYKATLTGYYDKTGFFTVSGAAPSVSFTMEAIPVYSYTVNAVDGSGNILKELATGSNYKDATITYYYNNVLNVNGTLYTAAADNNAYKSNFTLDSDKKVVTKVYSQPGTPITNLVFLSEGEDLFTRGTGSSADTRCSMGAGGYAGSKTAFVTLPAGTYYLVLSNRCSGARDGIHQFYKGDEVFWAADGNGYNATRESGEFTLSSTTTLYMQGGDNNQYVDWLYIYGTPTNEIIGALDNSTGFMGAAKSITISEGQTINLTFKNHGNDALNWYNWLVRLSGTTGVDHTLRADNYVIGDDGSTVSTRDIKENGGAINWEDFRTDMKDSEVEMTITYTLEGMFSITATSTGTNTYTHTFAYNAAKSGAITVELGVDHAWLEVLSEERSISKAITSVGYATFSSTYALDFTDVTDVTAYIATEKSGDKIMMQAITGEVAANTGLVLKSVSGSSATIDIPVVASGTAYNKDSDPKNYLFAINSDYNLTASGNGTNYVLSVQSGKVVFAPIGATTAPVTAGHAALWIPAVGARMLEMSFADDETTGISQIENRRLDAENSVYNLNGQRVTKPSKGLYIVGGKKVILK